MKSDDKSRNSLTIPIGAALISALLVLVLSSKYGIGLSPDSACYISIAENLLNGNGYAIYDLEPAVAWPPLYPAVLALAPLFNLDFSALALILNALLFAAVAFVSLRWLQSEISYGPFVWIGIPGIVLSPSLMLVGRFAWSELFFILLVVLFLTRVYRTGFDPTLKEVLVLGLIGSLACLTRYIGVTLIGGYLLWLLFCRFGGKTKLRYGATFAAVSLAPLVIWFARNYMVSSTLTGSRGNSVISFFKNVYYTGGTLSLWILPVEIPLLVRSVVLLCLLAVGVVFLARVRSDIKFKDKTTRGILILGGYSLIYSAFLIVASSLVAFDRIDLRLLSPIYLPLLLAVILFADNLVTIVKPGGKGLKTAIALASILWLGVLISNAYKELSFSVKDGAGGYSSSVWQNSQLTDYLLANPPSARLLSNVPDGIYALTRQSASMAPRKDLYHPPDAPTVEVLDLEKVLLQENSVLLAWFTNTNRGWMYEPQELSLYFKLDTVKTLRDGTLYRITSRSDAAP